jgi:hypothetical protein
MALLRIRVEQVKSQDPNQTSLAEQLNGMGKPYYEFIRAAEGTTDIAISTPYQPGTGELRVYLNGLKLQPTSDPSRDDGDYHEIDSHTIRFLEPLLEGDIVEVRMEGKGQGVAYVVDHFHAYKETPTGVVDGNNKIFLLSRTPRLNTELVFVNGMLKKPGAEDDYIIEGNKITFNEAPAPGSVILVNYEQAYVNA